MYFIYKILFKFIFKNFKKNIRNAICYGLCDNMRVEEGDVSVEQVQIDLNKKILFFALFVAGLSILLSGCLAYIFSDSLITIFCSIVFGVTLGILINYFLIISHKFITKIDVELSYKEETEELQTIMKLE